MKFNGMSPSPHPISNDAIAQYQDGEVLHGEMPQTEVVRGETHLVSGNTNRGSTNRGNANTNHGNMGKTNRYKNHEKYKENSRRADAMKDHLL